MSVLAPSEITQARSLGYSLLADVLAHGLTAATREAVRASQPLAAALDHDDDAEALAVEHEHAFGWAAPPFEGAYLDAEGIVGGMATDALWALYRAAGFQPDVRSVDVEHLSTSLRCLAFLSGAEADAIEDGHAGAIDQTRRLTMRLLDEHVLRWVPVFAAAVRRLDAVFAAALVDQIEALLLLHREQLSSAPLRFELPPLAALLEHESTGLREIGTLLATPALSGLVFTREDIARLGRATNVPRGFGDRAQLLVNLLRTAVQYDVLESLLDALDAEARKQIVALEAASYAFVAALTVPWRKRADRTRLLLGRIRQAAKQGPIDAHDE